MIEDLIQPRHLLILLFLLIPIAAGVALVIRTLARGETRKCPFCAEIVKREAVVCRFCGRDVPVSP
jgi:hypothetical protein